MNALLLTTLNGFNQTGLGAPFNKKAVSADAVFADLLGQQSEALNSKEQIAVLQGLHLDPQAQKALLNQLEQLGIHPEILHELSLKLQSVHHMSDAMQKNIDTAPSAIEVNAKAQGSAVPPSDNEQNNANFISSTLFVAQESNALRHAHAVLKPDTTQLTKSAFAAVNDALLLQPEAHNKNALKTSVIADAKTQNQHFTFLGTESKASFDSDLLKSQNPSMSWGTKAKDLQKTATQINLKGDLNAFKPTINTMLNSAPLATAFNAISASDDNNVPTFSLQSAITQTISQHALATTPFSATYSAQINTPLTQTSQWGADFGRVMVQLSQQASHSPGLQTAEIRLDPPELGPLRIVLSINDSVANAMIFAAHAQTRHTVEQALPQLQQQLTQAGLSLGEVSVSDQGFSAQSEQQSNQKPTNPTFFSLDGSDQNVENIDLLPSNTQTKSMNPNAIIDTFA